MIYMISYITINKEVGITISLNTLSNVIDAMQKIEELISACPLIRESLNNLFSDTFGDTPIDLYDSISSPNSYNESSNEIINAYRRYKNYYNFNLSQSIGNIESFLWKCIDNANMLDKFFTIINTTEEWLKFNISGTMYDDLISTIQNTFQLDEIIKTKQKLSNCIDGIIKLDKANAEEYKKYVAKLRKMEDTLNAVIVDDAVYFTSYAKMISDFNIFYYSRAEKNLYERAINMVNNLDCIDEGESVEAKIIDQRDNNRFAYFARYYYLAKKIVDTLKSFSNQNIPLEEEVEKEKSVYKKWSVKKNEELFLIDNKIKAQVESDTKKLNLSTPEEITELSSQIESLYANTIQIINDKYDGYIADEMDKWRSNYKFSDLSQETIELAKRLSKYYFEDNMSRVFEMINKIEQDTMIKIDELILTNITFDDYIVAYVSFDNMNDKLSISTQTNISINILFFHTTDIGNEKILTINISDNKPTDTEITFEPLNWNEFNIIKLPELISEYSAMMENVSEDSIHYRNTNLKSKLLDIVEDRFTDWRDYSQNTLIENYKHIFDGNNIDFLGKKGIKLMSESFKESWNDIKLQTTGKDNKVNDETSNAFKIRNGNISSNGIII